MPQQAAAFGLGGILISMVLHGQSSGCVIPKINQTMKLIFHVHSSYYTLLSTIPLLLPPKKYQYPVYQISNLHNIIELKSMLFPPQRSAIALWLAVLGGLGNVFFQVLKMQPCDPSSAFFGFMGVTSAFLFVLVVGDGVIITRGFDGGK